MSTTQYMSVIKHVAHTVPASKLLVGDVVATKGTEQDPQRLRRVDEVESKGGTVTVLVSTPRSGQNAEVISCKGTAQVCVVGRVEAAGRSKQTPAKVKVNAVAQTTPESAKPAARPAPKRQTPAPQSSLRSEIRTAIREAVGQVILDEVKAAIAEALA